MNFVLEPRPRPSPTNAYYAATLPEFITDDPTAVVRELTNQNALAFHGNRPEQAHAWHAQVPLLRAAVRGLPDIEHWSVLLEYSLRRLQKRPDAVLLGPGIILVIEFKMGADAHSSMYEQQAEDYALCIRDFHAEARGFPIVPIVCAENAPAVPLQPPRFTDGVSNALLTNASGLAQALRVAASTRSDLRPLTWERFDGGSYRPTPKIVDAARAIYAGHSVQEIGRSDAEGSALAHTAERLRHWVNQARENQEHVICLLTGTPGAGKSLLGLNLVLADDAGRMEGEPAVMLTGNRPLVEVLTQALVDDARAQGKNREVCRALQGSLQTLLGYLKQHAPVNAGAPPERIVVFDEAQRAWDEETGQKLLDRRLSEPALIFEILDRLPWACLVCLVGPGQEINRGEGGMPLWGTALEAEARKGRAWRVVAPSSDAVTTSQPIEIDPALHLSGCIRAYRSSRYGEWVDKLLAGELSAAASLAHEMETPPAFLTRDVKELKAWLRERARGNRRPGLLVSSGAVRAIAEGLPKPLMSNELKEIARWFLKRRPDFRGSDSLEVPLSEFGCQGLELDYVGLCWGGDLIWSHEHSCWIARKMSAPLWRTIGKQIKAQFRVNAYRVLLTRAREGVCVFVPKGDPGDPTRLPTELDEIARTLEAAGCSQLS